MTTYSPEDLLLAKRHRDEVKGVCFDWWLANIDGAGFALLREPHHTDTDIEAAKAELLRNRDVVGRITVRLPE